MKRSLMLALAGLVLVAPRALAGPGEVTAVSVLPGPGRAHVVIDVRGSVSVQDFTLQNPARLVIDVLGAKLSAPGVVYDGQNRGGIVNIRYAQFRPDVVRIVLELESLRGYELEYADDAIRVTLGTDRSFTAWSSTAPAQLQAPDEDRTFAPPPAVLPPATPIQVSQQPPVTASYDSATIGEVMAGFAELSGKSIVLGKDLGDLYVTAEINNQPWDVAFQAILESQGLSAIEEPPGIIRVDSRAALAARDSLEALETRIVRINYARAAALVPVLQSIVTPERGKVVVDTGTNSLIITDIESRIDDDVAFIGELDIQTPQVSIQGKLIFVNRTDIEELGVKYDLGSPTQFFNQLVQRSDPRTAQPIDTDGDGVPDQIAPTSFFSEDVNIIDLGGNSLSAVTNAEATIIQPALQLIFSTAIGNFSLTSFVDALQRVELADLQAEPLTSTADNTEAYILVGERTPVRVLEAGAQQAEARIAVEYVQTGILLRVTPHVTNNRQVLMSVRAENSSLAAAPSDVGFTFQTQEAESQVLVDDGQTAVIAGLTVTEVTVSKSGIPFLVDLPIIGSLFGFSQRREQRRDLLILVTPHIIDSPTASAETQ
ncbi:MAG: AMIN domain-containing protein [Gemmatimonadales bacterium]|nr:AMIN domain-containing protein [Gemmatimonadales bacterium]NIN11463.1 AMIN domain-containing protein [Gemmatimonadales bacterium]NIN50072.1 AMIN domain-containing protein [Gemmatimonadales bacterium]NIP07536.1 AMIN domain-containing protein [Gemmatimonadales bacterium]NIR03178.1 AMIN domain-containing protein [Gemmatimonadales bacterium]